MKCPKCKGEAILVKKWFPPEGYDPNMHLYKCIEKKCRFEFYVVKKMKLKEKE